MVFKGLGGQVCKVLVGHVLIGGPRNVAIYSKGALTLALPGQWTFGF